MKETRVLDKATNDYYKIRMNFELAGWIISIIGFLFFINGLLVRIKPSIVVGLLILSLGIGLVLFGRAAHLSFRK